MKSQFFMGILSSLAVVALIALASHELGYQWSSEQVQAGSWMVLGICAILGVAIRRSMNEESPNADRRSSVSRIWHAVLGVLLVPVGVAALLLILLVLMLVGAVIGHFVGILIGYIAVGPFLDAVQWAGMAKGTNADALRAGTMHTITLLGAIISPIIGMIKIRD